MLFRSERRLLEGAGIEVHQVRFDNADLREARSLRRDAALAIETATKGDMWQFGGDVSDVEIEQDLMREVPRARVISAISCACRSVGKPGNGAVATLTGARPAPLRAMRIPSLVGVTSTPTICAAPSSATDRWRVPTSASSSPGSFAAPGPGARDSPSRFSTATFRW